MADDHSLFASGQIGGQSNHAASVAASEGGEMKLFPIEGANVDNAISVPPLNPLPVQSPDSIFKSMNQGGGALGGTMNQLGEQVCDHLGAPHAKGDNLKMEYGELASAKAPTFVSEAGIKEVGMVGGGQGHG